MANKDSVIFYQGQIEICKRHLTDEQFGRLMFALFEIENGGDPDVDDDIIMAFEFMALQKKIDRKKYDAMCERNRENGKKGGRPKKTEENPNKANGFFENPNDKIMIREDNDKIREDNDKINETLNSSPSLVIDFLNTVTQSHYNVNDPYSVQLITDLIGRGYTVDDIKTVIRKKSADWLNDPVMRGYLRPSTLFGSKFSEYLAAPEPLKAEEDRNKQTYLNELRSKLQSKRNTLETIRTDISRYEEDSLTNLNSPYYQLKDQEAITEDDIKQIESRICSLEGG